MTKNESGSNHISDVKRKVFSCRPETVQPRLKTWDRLKVDVMPFQKEHFGLEEDEFVSVFVNPGAIIAILRDTKTKKAVGFTCAEPVHQVYRESFHPERERLLGAAYIQNTALHPLYMGYGLGRCLSDHLEGVRGDNREIV